MENYNIYYVSANIIKHVVFHVYSIFKVIYYVIHSLLIFILRHTLIIMHGSLNFAVHNNIVPEDITITVQQPLLRTKYFSQNKITPIFPDIE